MKRRSTCYLRFHSKIPLDQYQKVLFLFKQHRWEKAPALFTMVYPGEDIVLDKPNDCFVLRLRPDQTVLFSENQRCYVDVHPYLINGDEPAIPIFEIFTEQTLYQAEDLEV